MLCNNSWLANYLLRVQHGSLSVAQCLNYSHLSYFSTKQTTVNVLILLHLDYPFLTASHFYFSFVAWQIMKVTLWRTKSNPLKSNQSFQFRHSSLISSQCLWSRGDSSKLQNWLTLIHKCQVFRAGQLREGWRLDPLHLHWDKKETQLTWSALRDICRPTSDHKMVSFQRAFDRWCNQGPRCP